MLKKIFLLLLILAACCFAGAPAGLAQGVELTPEEEAQFLREPPITAADVDLFIKIAPQLLDSEAASLQAAEKNGWSKVRMVAVGTKIVMAQMALTEPEAYGFVLVAELFGEGFAPSPQEIALVKARLPEIEAILAEAAEPVAD